MSAPSATALDARIAALAARDLPLAVEILKEAIRIPADYVDKAVDQGGDPSCGLSNHEGPRLEYLKQRMIEIKAVASADDIGFDAFGNLVWTVEDKTDGIPRDQKKVVYLDGHCDTVKALRPVWREKTGGLDPYLGLFDESKIHRDYLRRELGHLPPDAEWEHMLFGRGSADQLGGVLSQIMGSRILVELMGEGSMRGVILRGYITVAEEDNDGGGPLYITRKILPGAPPEMIPDVVILTDSTGDSAKGALGIYRGQRGRMQIEVKVTGRSCHGSMPHEGLNPLEFGAAILKEAAEKHAAGVGMLDHAFLGKGTRTASWSHLDTPSDCAVPDAFTFRFDRRFTIGETPEQAVADVDALDGVKAARAAGLQVEVGVPTYDQKTWRGYVPGNPQIYMSWMTPETHPAVTAAVDAYRAVITPHVAEQNEMAGSLRRAPRVDRWVSGSVIAGSVLVAVFKQGFGRLRPDPAFADVVVPGLAFPSGHASTSAIVYLTLGALVAATRSRTSERVFILATAALMTILIGASRAALGVHWATDVIGGWAFGAGWAAIGLLLDRLLRRRLRSP